jgi:hypothetical protein
MMGFPPIALSPAVSADTPSHSAVTGLKERAMDSSPVVVRHFADRGTELAYGADVPRVGELISRFGVEWEVVRVAAADGRIDVTFEPRDGSAHDGAGGHSGAGGDA